MATHTSAELPVVFDCPPGEDGLAEFEPEAQRAPLWLRVDNPSAVEMRQWEPFVAPPRKRAWPLAVPIVVAAVLAGAAVSWLGMRTRTANLPSAPRPVETSAVADPQPGLTRNQV